VFGPGHTVWFTDQGNNRIGELDLSTQTFTFWVVPTSDATPLGMTRGGDGDLYFTERSVDKVGRLDPHTGLFTEWSLTSGAFPNRIVTAADGTVWFTELNANAIGHIDRTGHLTQQPLTGGPVGISYAGGHFFVALFTTGQLAELSGSGHVERSWSLPNTSGPLQVGVSEGAVWLTDNVHDLVYRVGPFCR
jgi:virginiamycin B lyase